jgi:hypothetical protein
LKIIEVVVSPQGDTKIETRGFAGTECQQASAFLEKALGLRQAEQLTAEYHSEASSVQRQQSQT